MYRIFLFLIICCPTLAFCCTCVGKESVKEAINKSDVVFIGKVLSKNIIIVNDDNLPPNSNYRKAQYILSVSIFFKGETKKDTIVITTGLGSGDCGFEFEIGNEYIVYSKYYNKYFERGSEVDKFLSTNICTRTKENNKCELRKLKRH